MQKRKKKDLDGIDREILRLLYYDGPLVGSKIGNLVGLSASAIAPRLENLKEKGIIRQGKVLGIRTFKKKVAGRTIKVNSPRSIYWEIDLKDEE
jgi:DNA-binding Lrp family transcriptional regulator